MSRHKTKNRKKDDGIVMNDAIRARELRVVGDDKKQFGIIPRDCRLEIGRRAGA